MDKQTPTQNKQKIAYSKGYTIGKQAGARIRSDRLLTENNELKSRINKLEYFDTSIIKKAKEQEQNRIIEIIENIEKYGGIFVNNIQLIKEIKGEHK